MSANSDEVPRRHSIADEPSLVVDVKAQAEAEARNGLLQFDLGLRMIRDAIAKGDEFKFRISMIQALHREALSGISAYAGNWRPAGISIEGSVHQPAPAHLVPEEVEALCDYLNNNWTSRSAVHLSAYTMWKLNWIHPFTDGNGRTSRVFSYVVLSIKLGWELNGTKTIPDEIVDNQNPYFEALEKADESLRKGIVDVSAMEELVGNLLARQLITVVSKATGQ